MNIKIQFQVFIACLCSSLFFLSACSTTPHYFDPDQQASASSAVVYIYRPNAMANALVTPDVVIDGNKLLSIKNNYYHYAHLPPGQHRIHLELDERYQGNRDISLSTRNGRQYFVRISAGVKFQMNKPYDRWFNIEQVPEAVALTEIIQCKPQAPETSAAAVENTAPADAEAEYSSQKFRNPFSR